MPRVYGVQDADDKLSGWMSEDETETAPTGETAVLESVIRAADPPGADGRIQSGGHWDGTTYTPPVGDEFFLPFDPTTDAGTVKVAAHGMMDTFDDALDFLERNANLWPAENITKAKEGIHWQWVNTARCCSEHYPHAGEPDKDLRGIRELSKRCKLPNRIRGWLGDGYLPPHQRLVLD